MGAYCITVFRRAAVIELADIRVISTFVVERLFLIDHPNLPRQQDLRRKRFDTFFLLVIEREFLGPKLFSYSFFWNFSSTITTPSEAKECNSGMNKTCRTQKKRRKLGEKALENPVSFAILHEPNARAEFLPA